MREGGREEEERCYVQKREMGRGFAKDEPRIAAASSCTLHEANWRVNHRGKDCFFSCSAAILRQRD